MRERKTRASKRDNSEDLPFILTDRFIYSQMKRKASTDEECIRRGFIGGWCVSEQSSAVSSRRTEEEGCSAMLINAYARPG